MEGLILRFGVVAVLLGAGIEGEPFAIAGGILAHRGWMPTWLAVVAAIAGALAFDQGWFHLTRYHRDSRIVRRVADRPAFAKSLRLIERHPTWFCLLFRFAYGLRAVAPVAIGASKVSVRLFVSLDVLASVVWGSAFTAAGYALGPAFEAAEKRYGSWIAIAAVTLSAAALAWALRGGRQHGR